MPCGTASSASPASRSTRIRGAGQSLQMRSPEIKFPLKQFWKCGEGKDVVLHSLLLIPPIRSGFFRLCAYNPRLNSKPSLLFSRKPHIDHQEHALSCPSGSAFRAVFNNVYLLCILSPSSGEPGQCLFERPQSHGEQAGAGGSVWPGGRLSGGALCAELFFLLESHGNLNTRYGSGFLLQANLS